MTKTRNFNIEEMIRHLAQLFEILRKKYRLSQSYSGGFGNWVLDFGIYPPC